jgi:hypothetical protein
MGAFADTRLESNHYATAVLCHTTGIVHQRVSHYPEMWMERICKSMAGKTVFSLDGFVTPFIQSRPRQKW